MGVVQRVKTFFSKTEEGRQEREQAARRIKEGSRRAGRALGEGVGRVARGIASDVQQSAKNIRKNAPRQTKMKAPKQTRTIRGPLEPKGRDYRSFIVGSNGAEPGYYAAIYGRKREQQKPYEAVLGRPAYLDVIYGPQQKGKKKGNL